MIQFSQLSHVIKRNRFDVIKKGRINNNNNKNKKLYSQTCKININLSKIKLFSLKFFLHLV